MSKTVVSARDISEAVRTLGLHNRPVCLHSSLRSFGLVEGGAGTVIRGFLDEGCTVMVPTFTYESSVPPPAGLRLPRNGTDDAWEEQAESSIIYSPDSIAVSDDMGAVPKALLQTPGRVRGDHPLDSFSAVGPLAYDMIGAQSGTDVYAPFRSLAERGGYVVLAGVGLTRMTLLHEAERLAGRNLFWRWAKGKDGETVGVQVGGCSDGFERLAPALEGLGRTYRVGGSLWRVFPVQEALERAAAAIRARPDVTRCDDPTCSRCIDAALGGPLTDAAFERAAARSWR